MTHLSSFKVTLLRSSKQYFRFLPPSILLLSEYAKYLAPIFILLFKLRLLGDCPLVV